MQCVSIEFSGEMLRSLQCAVLQCVSIEFKGDTLRS